MKLKNLLLILWALSFFSCSTEKPIDNAAVVKQEKKWWKEGIVYQIYPRSFNDSDGDGIGDLRGIIEKLDYIESLGVDIVWLNPFLASPNADNGYDVSDYRAIHPEFGTMEDFDEMLKGFHNRGIKFVLDVVVNHSSEEHEWFKQSRSSRDNPYRNYYHWWPAEKGEPPYRKSIFDDGSGAWEYDSTTNAYYLHYFAKQQPDLNWENEKLRQEVYDIMKFWAEKGVDGYRMDAFQYISKDTTFAELPPDYDIMTEYGMGPGIHPYLKELYNEVLSKYNVFAVSEGVGTTLQDAHDLVDADRNELQMAYHFEGALIADNKDYSLLEVKKNFSKWDSAFAKKGWNSIYLANHDKSRLVSRFGNDSPKFREASIKMLNTFILSMRGTPYCYYGDEIGMTNVDMPTIDMYDDIAAKNSYRLAEMNGEDMELFMDHLNYTSRDNGRTPMQWDDSKNAGFTSGNPWLPVNPNAVEINVKKQEQNPNSVLNHFRKMTALRKANEVLVYGDYELLVPDHKQVYAYTRSLGDKRLLIALNFSQERAGFPFNSTDTKVLINNYPNLEMNHTSIELEPYQATIVEISQ